MATEVVMVTKILFKTKRTYTYTQSMDEFRNRFIDGTKCFNRELI